MDNKKDIGKAFKERLEELQESPSGFVWDNIEAKLKRKKKRVIPFWIKIAGVAVLLLTIGGILVQKSRKIDTPIITVNKNETKLKNSKEVKNSKKEKSNNLRNKKEIQITTTNTTSTTKQVHEKVKLKQQNNTKTNHFLASNFNKNQIKQSNYKSNKKSNAIDNKTIKGVPNNIVNKEEKKQREFVTSVYHPISSKKYNYLNFCFAELPKIKEDYFSREKEKKEKLAWKISVKGTPIFSGTLLNDYFIDSSLDDYVTNDVSFSYGLQLSIPISNTIRLRTGIHKLNFSSNVHKIDVNALSYTSNISYVEGVIDGGAIYTNYADEESINLTQKINYFEIPLEVSFELLDKKIGINVITGMSALVLDNNTVLINNETKIGSVKNLNKLSYTGNVGLGIHYKLNKQINISVDPLFKFKFRGYNNVNNVSYYFGVYSGFSYKF